jgi:hypothetical protein
MLRAILNRSTGYVFGFGAILLVAGCCSTNSSVVLPPTINSVSPLTASDGACPNTSVTATFSEAMNPATINSSTFTLQGPGTSAVAGVVTYNAASGTATFTPSALLGSGVAYTATLTIGIVDAKGIPLASNYTWTFTTAANGCNPPPSVTAITPVANSTTACPNSVVTATFSQPMNTGSINATTFTLSPGVTGTVSHDASNTIFTLTPSSSLAAGKTYTATISTGAEDIYGNFLPANYVFSFTTAANGCHPAPTIIAVTPAAGSTTACPNAAVTATFSEPMNIATINSSSFTLAPGVVGTISHDATNTIFTLTPSSSLSAATNYTATISTAAQDTFGNSLASNDVWNFTTAANSCQPPPTVTSVVAAAGATGVCPNKVITATFSQPMQATSINAQTFLVTGPGTAGITGTVSYDAANNTAIFAPSASLPLNTTFTATITTGAKDTYGNNLASNFVWTFATGANTCLPAAPPVSVTPPSGVTGICPNTVITVTYAQAMNPTTITTSDFTVVSSSGTNVAGSVTHDVANKVYTFTPTAALSLSTAYTVKITTAAQDAFGNSMASNYVWTFTTGASTCIVGTGNPPSVILVTPAGSSSGVCLNSVATATFNEAMNPATINTNTFTIAPGITGTVTLDATDKVATFTPSASFAVSTTYTAMISTGAQSAGGTPLAANYPWSFTTSSQACQPPVPLGTAANYGILGAATVTNTGLTVITGENLGLSPGSSVTGFPPGVLTPPAIEDITDPAAAQAQLDATIAYNYMAGLPLGAALPSDLSGLTLTPGLYKNASTVALNSGTVTLDAQGNSNAVFIFQIGTTLTTIGNTQVLLTGGAQAANVYWQVGSAATLGTYSTFEGTIIALQSVTLQTGATLVGRALALNGAVTMDTNMVTAP